MVDINRTLHLLQERVKELTALHATARLLQGQQRPVEDVLGQVAELLPRAWQYPEITGARIQCLGLTSATELYAESAWMQSAPFEIEGEAPGRVDVCYREPRPEADEGPFLAEERELIESVAELLRAHVQQRLAAEALVQARESLEVQVLDRTEQLEKANLELRRQVLEQQRKEEQIREYQKQLQRLALELSLSEAKERREIASDLHDHIGQALAFMRLRLSELQGNAVFCGFEESFSEVMQLLEQTISYTRDLTVQISPPVLYEFGLGAALEWRARQLASQHGLKIKVERDDYRAQPDTKIAVMLFKSVGELLANVVKHAAAKTVNLRLSGDAGGVNIVVSDDGCGFDTGRAGLKVADDGKYGLFSVQERVRLLGGEFAIDSAPGRGTRVRLQVPILQERAGEED